MKYAISACLMGEAVRYDGRANPVLELQEWMQNKDYILLCPEVLGGLSIPRIPCERKAQYIMGKDGNDYTEYFIRGAYRAIEQLLLAKVDLVITKEKSPSCGCGLIYDGTFTGQLGTGDGVFVEALKKRGIPVYSCSEFLSTFGKEER